MGKCDDKMFPRFQNLPQKPNLVQQATHSTEMYGRVQVLGAQQVTMAPALSDLAILEKDGW